MTSLWKISGLTHDDEGNPRIVFRDEEGKFVYWQKDGWCGVGNREWEKHSNEEVARRLSAGT